MPDHFHLLLTPIITLEKAVQFIKGGFSYRAKKELGYGGEIWEHSFYDRRVRDRLEYDRFRDYTHQNPVKRGLAVVASEYPYNSAAGVLRLDDVPRRLKPVILAG
jgi:putative transposase